MFVVISIMGFAILSTDHSHRNIRYGAMFLAYPGIFSLAMWELISIVIICWHVMNLRGGKRKGHGTLPRISS